jgi:hypothetical protein
MDEMEKLRLQIRDRDLEIINLRTMVNSMKNCENCKKCGFDGESYYCAEENIDCTPQNGLKEWEPKE